MVFTSSDLSSVYDQKLRRQRSWPMHIIWELWTASFYLQLNIICWFKRNEQVFVKRCTWRRKPRAYVFSTELWFVLDSLFIFLLCFHVLPGTSCRMFSDPVPNLPRFCWCPCSDPGSLSGAVCKSRWNYGMADMSAFSRFAFIDLNVCNSSIVGFCPIGCGKR